MEIGETHHFRKHPLLPYQTFLLRAENGKLFPWWNRKQKTAKPQSILPQPKDLQNEGPPKEPAKIQAKHQQHLAGGMKFRDESFRNIRNTHDSRMLHMHNPFMYVYMYRYMLCTMVMWCFNILQYLQLSSMIISNDTWINSFERRVG